MEPHPTLRRLNREWDLLAAVPPPGHWSDEAELAGAESLGAVLASIREAPDEVLAALLRIGDPPARRVVLQALLGWAMRASARDRDLDLDDYLGELWLGIANYRLDRRPSRIAANLTLDARKRVRARTPAVPVDPTRLGGLADRGPGSGAGASLLLDRARRVELLDEQSARALRLVYAHGLAHAEAAALLGTTPAALRQRCHRAVRRLAAHAADLRAAVG
ncbi:MAG: sigma factor-like helix-turn-helix DNA-binding protein [Propionicimonas sp.]